uniref:Uncharacterized protein n=1 Tax=Oncorhynchus kisutch TaxID=8019 RepID=A0A8C7MZI3_ONCKI
YQTLYHGYEKTFFFTVLITRTTFLRFGVGGEQVGRVPCKSGVHFEYISNLFNPPHGGAISLCQKCDSFRREGSLTVLKGWRDEMRGKIYEVMPRVCDTPLMLKRYGVHINGYCQDENGELQRWHFSTSTPWTRSTTTFEHLKSCMMVLMSGP